jgi:hypothetical protein
MIRRTTTRTVTFKHSFAIKGLDGWQPAGSYIVDTEEELLQALSFPAWHRIHTSIRLPQKPGRSMVEHEVTLDPAAIDAALTVDAAAGE